MQSRTIYLLLTCLLILTTLTAYFFLAKPFNQEETSNIEVNVCLHIWDYSNESISYLKDLNVKWVRTDWVLTSDNLMSDYASTIDENFINLLAIIDINTFDQQNPTLVEWNNTVTNLVSSEDFSSVDAVEIWNEPNAEAYIPPTTYYEILKSAYVIIKNYTSAEVVFAGVSPNIDGWQNYLNEVFMNGDVENYFDYMGIHMYDVPQTNLSTLDFIQGLTSKPIWLTETGKPSENNDEKSQATYLSTIYETIAPKVAKVFIYELYDNQGLEPPKENYFGLLTIDGVKKEAYDIIKNLSY
jgi:hypothetical protein